MTDDPVSEYLAHLTTQSISAGCQATVSRTALEWDS